MTFLPTLTILLTFTATAAVLIITPGPDMTLFMSKTLTQGRRAGIAAVLGASTGLIIHSLFAALGLSALLAASETGFYLLKFVGAGYLIYLAFQSVRSGSALTLETVAIRKESFARVWAQGLTINLLNPKIVIFFITFLPQFVNAGDPNAAAKLLFLGLYFVVIGMPACLAMVYGAHSVSSFLKSSPKAMRTFDWVFAGIMSTFALKLLAVRAAAN